MIRFPNPWAYNQRPPSVNPRVRPRYTVHICVPCYNEPSDIVFATCEAALSLRHEWCKVHVYMLDDGRNLEREKKVMMMGNDRFVYLARNKFPGVPIHGKAGNINSALKFHIFAKKPPTENDVVIIFDADMKAHPNFLNHVMPYLEEDPMTALVQTPQHFFNVDHTGDVFNHQNSTFFFGVQTGLDAWRATVCCGTNFAVRAAPLAAVGWFPTESITEDFLLSLKLTASGWHCRYHGHVLTTGEAPEDLRQIFKQRSRWCTGCFQVFFQVETFMWVRQLPAIQMLCYFNSIMGYLSTIICFPVFLIVPVRKPKRTHHQKHPHTPAIRTPIIARSLSLLSPALLSPSITLSGRLRLHEDPSRKGAHDRPRHPMDLLLYYSHRGRRDDAAAVLALHRLPGQQGELHHVVVLSEGDVEGGARPPGLQEDRLQGDREEGRREDEEGGG